VSIEYPENSMAIATTIESEVKGEESLKSNKYVPVNT